MTNPPLLETTPRTYYKEYITDDIPDYDLYPSLSRRLGNGYVHQPSPPICRQSKDINFISIMNAPPPSTTTTATTTGSNPTTMANSTVSNQQLASTSSHAQDSHPSWDLYPSILRNVENFGTEQMRQQLHAMETTTM